MTTTTLIEGERGGGHHHRARKEMNRYPSSNESYEKDEKTDHQKDRVIKMRRKKQKAFLALEQQHRTMGMTTSSNRKVDKPLVCVAALILCLVIFVELKTSPRKIARRAMESVEHLFHYMEKGGDVHAQMLSWRGWHSLEVGVEIACALTLAFLNWLLFASLFDVAGIVVGLIPAMATFLGVLVFRFHGAVVFRVSFDTVSGSSGDRVREAFREEDAGEGGEEDEGEERAQTRAEDGERDEASEWFCGER